MKFDKEYKKWLTDLKSRIRQKWTLCDYKQKAA